MSQNIDDPIINSDPLKEEDHPKRNEELNSKFSVFLNKKEKTLGPYEGTNEPNENLGESTYGRSYLKKMKASTQRKYIKDEKHPKLLRPPLPDSIRSKQSIYMEFKKKKENLEREKEFLENNPFTNVDSVKKFSGSALDPKYTNSEQSVNEFAHSLRNKKAKTKVEEIPEFIKQDMRVNIKLIAAKIPLLKEQIQKVLIEIIENKISLDNLKYRESEKKSNLKEIKTQRNHVIAERISLSKELEIIRNSMTHNTVDKKYIHQNYYNSHHQIQVKSSSHNSAYNSNPFNNNNYSNNNLSNYNSFNVNSDSDSICNELEQKISQLKLENAKFYENIDMLNEEIVENESINKNLKVQLKNWDKILDSLVKERNAARAANGKYGSNAKYGSVI